jgi:hypothetical protein
MKRDLLISAVTSFRPLTESHNKAETTLAFA